MEAYETHKLHWGNSTRFAAGFASLFIVLSQRVLKLPSTQ